MDILVTEELWTLLLISLTFSIFLMALIQKFKTLSWLRKKWQIWVLNFCFAFLMGIPFSMFFYELSVMEAIWVSVFGFIGAPSLYEALKKQNIISYKPKSLKDVVSIPKANEIKRGEAHDDSGE